MNMKLRRHYRAIIVAQVVLIGTAAMFHDWLLIPVAVVVGTVATTELKRLPK